MLVSSGFTHMKPNIAMLKDNYNADSRIDEPGISRTPAIRNQPVETLLSQFKSHSLDDLRQCRADEPGGYEIYSADQ